MRQCLWYVVTEDTQVNANSHIHKRLGIKERNWMTNNCFGKRISVLSIGLLRVGFPSDTWSCTMHIQAAQPGFNVLLKKK